MEEIRFVDTTRRDGHQSLSAEGMRTGMILPIAERAERVREYSSARRPLMLLVEELSKQKKFRQGVCAGAIWRFAWSGTARLAILSATSLMPDGQVESFRGGVLLRVPADTRAVLILAHGEIGDGARNHVLGIITTIAAFIFDLETGAVGHSL